MLKLFLCFAVVATGALKCYGGEIPFTLEKGFVIISAKAKKDVPIEAAIFTGSAYSFFNNDVLKRLRLQLSSTNDLLVSGANREQAVMFANIPQLVVSDEKPVEVKMRQSSFDAINRAAGRNIDVILGADYFDGKIVQIDFQKRVIRFRDKPAIDYGAAKSVSAPAVRLILKMEEHVQTVFGNIVSLPISDDVSLNGVQIRSLFDTGVAFPVSIGPFATKKNSFGTIPDNQPVGQIQLKTLSLNGYEFANVPALLRKAWDDNEKRYAAIIGIGVLQNFTVTFDWKNKWIVLEK